ncbi:MAG TPA: amidase family protein [Actinospica sp.]|nr:amidase family protein [Actinospica sp.]
MDSSIWRVVGAPLLVTGSGAGPLAGGTVAVKDLFAVEGHAVGAGNPAYLEQSPVASAHAAAVRRLLDLGASIRGIARTDEFAYSIMGANAHYGAPPNPNAPLGMPGGSSSGPASAVASGEASIGLGTDTAGSVRVPASWQGLWGLRTTHGAVSREGLLPLAPSFDTVGWLTRSPDLLADLARTADGGAAGGEFVVCRELVESADAGVRRAFEERIKGLDLRAVRLPDIDAALPAFRTAQAAEAWRAHGEWVSAHPDALGADIAARFAWAATVTADQEAEARSALSGLRAEAEAVLGDAVLLLPTTPTAAPPRTADAAELDAVRAATIRLTCLAPILGRPALSAPLLEGDGAPVGLSLLGPQGSDVHLVKLGEEL